MTVGTGLWHRQIMLVAATAVLGAVACAGAADVDERTEFVGRASTRALPESAEVDARAVRAGPTESTFDAGVTGAPLDRLGQPVCATGVEPDELTAFFDGADPLLGADYQHATPLPDGHVLWLFHDVFLPGPTDPVHLHNAGLLQSGRCFQLLRGGTDDAPLPYLFGDRTEPFRHWFWPLDADVGADGRLHVFVAEMYERTPTYLTRVEPVANWIVTIDPTDLRIVGRRLAPDSSDALYGWAVVSAGAWTYLYGHCFRQFGWDPLWFAPSVRAHDLTCGPEVTVARIPRGEFGVRPRYWNGADWVDDAAAAVAVIPTGGRAVNPTQIELWNGRFVAVTKVHDWWGDTVVLDVADEAAGPWTTYASVVVRPECGVCNTYFASFVPFGVRPDSFVIGLSSNVWTGDDLTHYSPRFLRVATPP